MRSFLARGRGGPWLFFCRYRELFVSESVWRVFFKGYELGDFCECFDVECSGNAYVYVNYFDACFQYAVGLESLFKRFVDSVDVVYDLLRVPISGVFAFDELKLSSSLEGRVSNELDVGPKCVSNRLDEVRYVACRSVLCREDVFRYSLLWFRCVKFVVL